MKYFIDTEFNERPTPYMPELISLAVVAEDGRELYLLNSDFSGENIKPFVRDHVLPHISAVVGGGRWTAYGAIARLLTDFIGDDEPEFWGYYSDYDWVVMCQVFGGMENHPSGWPYYCRDLKQLIDERGLDISQDDSLHDALDDALWVRKTYMALVGSV